MHKIVKTFFLTFLLCVVTLMFMPGNAFAKANEQGNQLSIQKSPDIHCAVQEVHLNGSAPATITCLDNQQQQKSISPAIGMSPAIGIGCTDSSEVTLWWDSSFSGDVLCFSGNGFANLTNYAPAWYNVALCHCTSWNDQASSFALYGCALIGTNKPSDVNYPGYFASDANGGGQLQYFKSNASKSWSDFTGSNGILGSDTLSSIYIDC